IMDNSIVVGVGNIYASEALFLAEISPLRKGYQILQHDLEILVISIKQVLISAINQGGSSLRDYKQVDGTLGYFQNSHLVYNKTGQNCTICNTLILSTRLGQRNSFYCPSCQK
ncbi:MAG: formamidopyrimidine-DNA glycosylase, partial [Burkholderiales bacterium]|nr:formamidopyrimidine-DNA glycosylase [Burkholderiales bacterium]